MATPLANPGETVDQMVRRLRQNDTACLAPLFRAAVERAVGRANAAGCDASVFETCRSNELQAVYYAQGATRARTAYRSWHFYGLAVDVVSRSREWAAFGDREWVRSLVAAFKAEGLLAWGGDWASFKDEPHWQWHRCKPSPSDLAIQLYQEGGRAAVWRACRAA